MFSFSIAFIDGKLIIFITERRVMKTVVPLPVSPHSIEYNPS